jgi:hypothetical protein
MKTKREAAADRNQRWRQQRTTDHSADHPPSSCPRYPARIFVYVHWTVCVHGSAYVHPTVSVQGGMKPYAYTDPHTYTQPDLYRVAWSRMRTRIRILTYTQLCIPNVHIRALYSAFRIAMPLAFAWCISVRIGVYAYTNQINSSAVFSSLEGAAEFETSSDDVAYRMRTHVCIYICTCACMYRRIYLYGSNT